MSVETKEIIHTASLASYRKSTSVTISGKDGTQIFEHCIYCGMPKGTCQAEGMPNSKKSSL